MKQYGIAATDRDMFGHILEAIWMEALQYGTKTKVYPMVHFDRTRHVLYLFDHDKSVYRITSRGKERVQNGTDGILFVRQSKWTPFVIDLDARADFDRITDALLGSLRLDSESLARNDVELLVSLWTYSLFFPELFPTRVILAFVGEKGSGKTSSFSLLGTMLFGSAFQVTDLTDDLRDLDAAITSDAFVAIDNVDRAVRGLEDKLAVAATGGTLKRRQYYTTNRLVEYPITATIGVTARTPYFRREDVADRLLVIRVERFEEFVSLNRLRDRLLACRDELMSIVVANLQRMVAALEQTVDQEYASRFRMADFAEFAHRIGPPLGVDDVEAVLGRLARVQLRFTTEDEPLLEFLDEWLKQSGKLGKPVTTRQLFQDLHGDGLYVSSRTFPYANPLALGQRISELKGTLRSLHGMEEQPRRSHGRAFVFRHLRPTDDEEAA
jgi:hypothetical protein